ncbi:MAG TPA: hypothetical protein VFG68_09165 [Fimbriiglobus sp.]|nr:hypothetical protein [Fimbriiglobus sp.]
MAEPIARFVPGADGVVDLYLMPAYDDIASLYYQEGEWKLHYALPGDLAVAHPKEGEAHPLTKEVFGAAVGEMAKHAA